jgi:Beta-galactosidase
MLIQYTVYVMTKRKTYTANRPSGPQGAARRSGAKREFIKLAKLAPLFLIAIFYLIFINLYTLGSIYSYLHRNDEVKLGVSFSANQARYYGSDPKENLEWLVEKKGFKNFRLMSYWLDAEKVEGQFDFSDLKWQLDYLSTIPGANVTLAIGTRQPRWPECHVPDWLSNQYNEINTRSANDYDPHVLAQDYLKTKLLIYLEKTLDFVNESGSYQKPGIAGLISTGFPNNPIITSYQLENEAANEGFAQCYGFNQARLKSEYDLVKRLDPTRPIIINASNQHGLPMLGQIGDKVGFSIYRKARLNAGFVDVRFIPPQIHAAKAALIKLIFNKESFVHELQAEPWGSTDIKNITPEEQDSLMSPKDVQDNIDYALKTGMKEVYLWGGEWWYWREVAY